MATPDSMPTYSADELMHLKDSLAVVKFDLSKLSDHPFVVPMLRLPSEFLEDRQQPALSTKVLFELTKKAKLHRQQSTEGSRQFSSEESEERDHNNKMSRHQEPSKRWQLRQRDISENNLQPYSAPTDVTLQQSENFKRFYQAVVSPTHVRVTAGGRIVPNTRGLAPPKLDWNADRHCFEKKPFSGSDTVTTIFESVVPPVPAHGSTWAPSAMAPGYHPTLPPQVQARYPPPYHFFPQGNNFMAPQMGPLPFPGPAVYDGILNNKNGSSTRAGPFSQHLSVKISPPDQFDHSKPFMFNGQMVYPIPAGYQPPPNALPVPMGMIGNPNFHQPVGATAPGPYALSGGQMHIGNFHMPPPGPHGMAAPMMGQVQMPFGMPGFIPVSELTKMQIDGSRSHLKMVETQIAQYGRQSDTTQLEVQRKTLCDHIERMERMMKSQVDHENSMHAHHIFQGNGQHPLAYHPFMEAHSAKTPFGRGEEPLDVQVSETPASPKVHDSKKEETFVPAIDVPSKSAVRSSKLSVAAAMAPAFQPRHILPDYQPRESFHTLTSGPETHEQAENRLMSNCSTDWAESAATRTPFIAMPKSKSMYEPPTQPRVTAEPGIEKFAAIEPKLEDKVISPVLGQQSTPYLIGIIPHGTTFAGRRDDQVMYSRALTTEELQARRLYFGMPLGYTQSILPKFDGKDFYPPSPDKAAANPPTASAYSTSTLPNDSSRRRSSQATDVDSKVAAFCNEARLRGYRVSTPLRQTASLQNLNKSPQSRASVASRSGAFNIPMTPDRGDRASESKALDFSRIFTEDDTASPDRITRTPDFSKIFTEPSPGDMKVGTPDFSKLFTEGTPGDLKAGTPLSQSGAGKFDFSGIFTGRTSRSGSGVIDNKPSSSTKGHSRGGSGDTRLEAKDDGQTSSAAQADNDESSKERVSVPTSKLPPVVKALDAAFGATYAERLATINNPQQQSLFLQNILRNAVQSPHAATAVPVSVTSATAQGYLPNYRGSAVASLTPAMTNGPSSDTGGDNGKDGHASPMVVSSVLSENRPLRRVTRNIASSSMTAEGYMRFLAQQPEEELPTQQAWPDNGGW